MRFMPPGVVNQEVALDPTRGLLPTSLIVHPPTAVDDQASVVTAHRLQIRFDGNSHLIEEAINVELEPVPFKLDQSAARADRFQHVTLEETKSYTDSFHAR